MKQQLWGKLRHSFPVRLTFYIFSVVAGVFILALVIFTTVTYDRIREEAMHDAEAELSQTVRQIETLLDGMAMVAENLGGVVPHALAEGRSLHGLPEMVLQHNPGLYGCALAFHPVAESLGKRQSPYAYRSADSICTVLWDIRDYSEADWFVQPCDDKRPYWSKPYFDELGAKQWMVTYAYPLTDAQGVVYAVLTADLSILDLERIVHQMNPFPQSHSLVLDSLGNYVVRPNDFVLEKKNIFSSAENVSNADLRQLGLVMASGKTGCFEIDRKGDPYLIFYAPVHRVGWAVAVGCREADLFVDLYNTIGNILLVACLALVCLVVLCYGVIRHMTRPLVHLATSASYIAKGNFSEVLPDVNGKDEMSALRRSFATMQRSLVQYMEDLKQSTIQRERIESDLRIAGDIQQRMVPTQFPTYPACAHLDVAAKLVPAKMVGGDFYHFFFDGDDFYFIIGDVSGKGVPAALVMSAVCRLFRTVALHLRQPGKIMAALNDALGENNEMNLFATAFMGILHQSSGRLDYCNAGHNASVLMEKEGQATWMQVRPNLPLGAFEGFTFEEQTMAIDPGTSLLLYSDGVTEAENIDHTLFSEERLLEFSQQMAGQTSQHILDELYCTLQGHVGMAEQSDDITMLCITYEPQKLMAYGKDIETQQ